MAFNEVTSPEVDAQAPITSQLFTKIWNNLDHLKSAITDGSGASQGVSTTTLETSGTVELGDSPTFGGKVLSENVQAFALNDASTSFTSDVSVQGTRTNASGNELADQSDALDWYRLRFLITSFGMGKGTSRHSNREEA